MQVTKLKGDDHKVYQVWKGMMARCTNPKHKSYEYYGGKGVTVSDDWKDSRNFLRDMLPRPPAHQLERIDGEKGYSKENCVWATRLENMKNLKIYKSSTTGIAGVVIRENKKSFRATLKHDGKSVLHKTFSDFFEACCARKSAELLYIVPNRAK